jgi:hypothetical protein
MKADRFLGEVSRILVDVAGRDVAFSEQNLTNEQLAAVGERIQTLVAFNKKHYHVAGKQGNIDRCEFCGKDIRNTDVHIVESRPNLSKQEESNEHS